MYNCSFDNWATKQKKPSKAGVVVVVMVLALYGSITTRRKYKGTSSMNCRELGSHARDKYLTQDTSRMETERVKREVGSDTRVIVKG